MLPQYLSGMRLLRVTITEADSACATVLGNVKKTPMFMRNAETASGPAQSGSSAQINLTHRTSLLMAMSTVDSSS